jgi:hypothetical protein
MSTQVKPRATTRQSGATVKESTGLYPSLYQVNTRVLIYELEKDLGRPATLDDIGDDYLDGLSQRNFDWVWFLGVWQGTRGAGIARTPR